MNSYFRQRCVDEIALFYLWHQICICVGLNAPQETLKGREKSCIPLCFGFRVLGGAGYIHGLFRRSLWLFGSKMMHIFVYLLFLSFKAWVGCFKYLL